MLTGALVTNSTIKGPISIRQSFSVDHFFGHHVSNGTSTIEKEICPKRCHPALLSYLEQKYINPVRVFGLKIPSSTISKELWDSLQSQEISRNEVLLDGAGNATEFCDLLDSQTRLFPDWDHYFYRPIVFDVNKLLDKDIDFLNGMRWGRKGRELPAIRISLDANQLVAPK